MKETAYLMQAALVSSWWVGLTTNERFFAAFQFDGIPSTAFWAFFAPDVILIAAFSVLRSYRKVANLEFIILGAFGYASLYCLNATLLTNSGYLPTGLMLLGLGYNLFVCFSHSLFRNSSSSYWLNVVKTLVQVVCIWVLALLVIPGIILDAFDCLAMPSGGISIAVGPIVFSCFSLLGLTSAFVMVRDGAGTPLPLDQTNQLVVSGPYRYVRNPMAVAGIGQGLALAILFQSLPLLVYAVLGAVVWHVVVRPMEERDLVQRFGDPYVEYRKKVFCWIPTIQSRGS